MFNFTKTNKSDSLNDKLQELENRFQEKMDEQSNAYKLHIQKLDEKFAGMEEKNKITYELMDKLYEYRFQEINNNTAKLSTKMSCKINQCISVYDNKLDNTFTTLQEGMQNITNQINILNNNQKEILIEIQKLQNNAGNYFEEQIDTLTKQQEVTNEKLVALNENYKTFCKEPEPLQTLKIILQNEPYIEDTIIQSINQEIVDIAENKKKIPLSGKERAKKFYDKNPEKERLRKNEYYKQQRILKGFPPPKKSHKYIGTECIDNQNAIMEHYYYEKSISYDGEAERLMSINL